MRIAAADFDGTVYTWTGLIGDLHPAIDAWRRAGNRFGIATGRDYPMIMHEIRKQNLDIDFVVCMNGALVVDRDGHVIHKHYLDDAIVQALLRHPAAEASTHIQLSGHDITKAVLRGESWFSRIGIPFDSISFEDALGFTGLGQISLAYDSEEQANEWSDTLLRDFPDALSPHPNRISIDLNARGVSKASGLDHLVAAMCWEGHPVHVIGDGVNDIEMIRRFDGYTVPNASAPVHAAATKVYDDVGAMLMDVLLRKGIS